jgi:uncharacterized protein
MTKLPTYRRPVFDTVLARITEPRDSIQVLAGPRQAGKTTLAIQAAEAASIPSHYASADDTALREGSWIYENWSKGRELAEQEDAGAILILDEVQKITRWSEAVKRLWDEDGLSGIPLRVLILGSAPLLVQRGLTESLFGRFETIRAPHWSFPEMRDAFDWDLDRYLFFGGYPGTAGIIEDEDRWSERIRDSMTEMTISRDVLLLTRIDKPALLRRLFQLGCDYSGQILSYNKMVAQLEEAGSMTTLAHYLELLGGAGMVTGLQKFSGSAWRVRGSSPKLIALNTALMTAHSRRSFADAREDETFWGRLIETAAGAHLINTAPSGVEVMYWRHGNHEVDFVVPGDKQPTVIEVKSGPLGRRPTGFHAFEQAHGPANKLLVGPDGIPLEDFLSRPTAEWLK